MATKSTKDAKKGTMKMCKSRNFLIALAWCWASAFISLLIMADNGTFAVEDLPVYAFMATIALFVGPLFFAAGLFDMEPESTDAELLAYLRSLKCFFREEV